MKLKSRHAILRGVDLTGCSDSWWFHEGKKVISVVSANQKKGDYCSLMVILCSREILTNFMDKYVVWTNI